MNNQPLQGDLRVWWIPQIPGKWFIVPVRTLREASLLLDVLADYDAFQYRNRIKPDYSNTGGLQIYDTNCPDDNGDCWVDWYDEESGDDFDTYRENHPELREAGTQGGVV